MYRRSWNHCSRAVVQGLPQGDIANIPFYYFHRQLSLTGIRPSSVFPLHHVYQPNPIILNDPADGNKRDN